MAESAGAPGLDFDELLRPFEEILDSLHELDRTHASKHRSPTASSADNSGSPVALPSRFGGAQIESAPITSPAPRPLERPVDLASLADLQAIIDAAAAVLGRPESHSPGTTAMNPAALVSLLGSAPVSAPMSAPLLSSVPDPVTDPLPDAAPDPAPDLVNQVLPAPRLRGAHRREIPGVPEPTDAARAVLEVLAEQRAAELADTAAAPAEIAAEGAAEIAAADPASAPTTLESRAPTSTPPLPHSSRGRRTARTAIAAIASFAALGAVAAWLLLPLDSSPAMTEKTRSVPTADRALNVAVPAERISVPAAPYQREVGAVLAALREATDLPTLHAAAEAATPLATTMSTARGATPGGTALIEAQTTALQALSALDAITATNAGAQFAPLMATLDSATAAVTRARGSMAGEDPATDMRPARNSVRSILAPLALKSLRSRLATLTVVERTELPSASRRRAQREAFQLRIATSEVAALLGNSSGAGREARELRSDAAALEAKLAS